jgi:23S rRNA pseudouridine1911/1915/1917 synthase
MGDPGQSLRADRGDAGRRLDLMLRRHVHGRHPASRTRVQAWIRNGRVTVNGDPVRRTSARVALGDVVEIASAAYLAERTESERTSGRGMAAEDLPLDVLYEDDHLLALNKPAGLVVHPGYRNTTGTLMNGLMWRAREWPTPQRPSIVGRLDKLTSGIVLVARSAAAHAALQRAMAERDAQKDYLAVIYGRLDARTGRITSRLRRDTTDRRRVVASSTDGALSICQFERLGRVAAPRVGLSLIRCQLITGRTHQLRVQLASRGWPIVGDPTYGEPRWSRITDPMLAVMLKSFPRQALHAWRLAFTHPDTRTRVRLEAPPPPDLEQLLAAIGLPLGQADSGSAPHPRWSSLARCASQGE